MPNNSPAAALMHAWMQRSWLAWLLSPLSIVFGMVLTLRIFLYRHGWLKQYKLPVPVIVVGNIFVGGTGKTPLAVWLLKQLKLAGYRPGVISRGYGGKQDAARIVTKHALAEEVGDEPILIAQQSGCPIVVGRNRVQAGLTLLSTHPEVNIIVSDDGLQHLALARNVEIVLFDARGTGNGWLLPAGPLREPVSRARDLTIVNLNDGEQISADLPSDTVRMQLHGNHAVPLMQPNGIRPLAAFDPALKIVAAAGIGNPERFFAMLRGQGLHFSSLPLPDHFDFAGNPFKNLTADLILITEKDAVKCRQSQEIAADARIWVVPVEAELDSGAFLRILNRLSNQA